ncbi:MAG: hypothetical protein HQL73_09625 [Magnetococcales bacterium]|nr:hypothetical protein [Magnetococcales bacterium]
MKTKAKTIWTIAHRAARLTTCKDSIEYIKKALPEAQQRTAIRMMSQAAFLRILADQV